MARPDFEVYLVTKQPPAGHESRVYTKIGVGWHIFDGEATNIVLNPGTVVDWRMCQDFFITIKPRWRGHGYNGPPPHTDADDPRWEEEG